MAHQERAAGRRVFRRDGILAVLVIAVLGLLAAAPVALLVQVEHERSHDKAFDDRAHSLAGNLAVSASLPLGRAEDMASLLSVGGVPSQKTFIEYLSHVGVTNDRTLHQVAFAARMAPETAAAQLAAQEEQIGRSVELRPDYRGAPIRAVLLRTDARSRESIGLDLAALPGTELLLRRVLASRLPTYFQLPDLVVRNFNAIPDNAALGTDGPAGFTGFMPVTHGRSRSTAGWLATQFDFDDMLTSPSETTHLQLQLVDPGFDDPAFVLSGPDGRDRGDATRTHTSEFSAGGARWNAVVWTTASAGTSPLALITVLVGLVTGVIVGLLVASRLRARHIASALTVSERDRRVDELTGVPNRLGLSEALDEALPQGAVAEGVTAVMFCDIDRFKVINDSLGHHVGDQLLRVVAGRLRASVRPGDVVGRFGGDEFVVVCRDIGDENEASSVARRMIESMATPIRLDGIDIDIEISVGIAMTRPGLEVDAESLLRDADAAMYSAKRNSAGLRTFDGAMHQEVTERLEIERALRAGLRRDLVAVEFQPILNLPDQELVGFEALARFDDPVLREAGPAHFVPIAEEIGLGARLGQSVLEEACRQLAEWNRTRSSAEELFVSVNVGGMQLRDPSFAPAVERLVKAKGFQAGQLVLEISEHLLVSHHEHVARLIKETARFGVEISIDDFGTGGAALSDLSQLRGVSEVKIDRALVSGPGAPHVRHLLVSAIAQIAGQIDARLVAEGIEAPEDLRATALAGVTRAQGFFFARPAPAETFVDLHRDAGSVARGGGARSYESEVGR